MYSALLQGSLAPPQNGVDISIVVCTRFPVSEGTEFTRGGDAVFLSRLSTSTVVVNVLMYVCSVHFPITRV